MRNFIFACAGAAAIATLVTVAVGRSPAPPVVAKAPAPEPSLFDETWRDLSVPLALKSASLFATEPKPVLPEKIIPPLLVAPEPEKPKPEVKQAHVKNLCERHGMKKVATSKFGWRCQKP